ncbi:MAG: hypothetical protein AAGA92_11025 [Planctomycetota bacterium]
MRHVLAIAATLLLPATSAGDEFADKLQRLMAAGKAGGHAAAAEACRELALSDPQNPNAAQAHYAAIVFAAQAWKTAPEPEKEQAQKRYGELLGEHIDRWPVGPHAPQARLLLVEHELRSRGVEAITGALRLSSADTQKAVIDAAIDSCNNALRSADDHAERVTLLNSARKQLQPLITGDNNEWPKRWTPLQVRLAIRLSEWHLAYHPQGGKYAERMLTAAATAGEECPESLKRIEFLLDCRGLIEDGPRPVSVALQGFFADSAQHRGTPEEAVRFVRAITAPLIQSSQRTITHDLRRLAGVGWGFLAAHDLAESPLAELKDQARELGLPQDAVMTIVRFRVLFAYVHFQRAGYIDKVFLQQSRDACRRWIELAPTDLDAVETDVHLLWFVDTLEARKEALVRITRLEGLCKPASERWRRVRRDRIAILRSLDQTEEADKLQSLTELLYPDAALTP